MEVAVGVDIGSTSTKIVVLGADDEPLVTAHFRSAWFDGPGGPKPAAIVARLVGEIGEALDRATATSGRSMRVVGLGVASFAESGVLVDAAGRELTAVLPWYDARGEDLLAALPADFRDSFASVTGLPVSAQWSLVKLLWFRSQGLAVEGTWLSVAEYVAFMVTGARFAEPSLASRTGMLDQNTGEPIASVRRLLGTTADVLPALRQAGSSWGYGRPALGALSGVPVTVAGHDHIVAAYGHGVVGPDEMLNSFGTADALVRVLPGPLSQQQRAAVVARGLTQGRHIIPNQYVLLGGTRGGLVLRRVLTLLGEQNRAGLDAALTASRPGTGDGPNVSAVTARGAAADADDVVIELHEDAAADQVWAAALDHIGEELAQVVTRMLTGSEWPQKIVATGGWMQMESIWRARRVILPGVRRSPLSEAGAVGAARLGRAAAQLHPAASTNKRQHQR